MTLASKLAVTFVMTSLFFSVPCPAQNPKDRWFAKDKYGHFLVSAFYSTGTAKVAHRHFELGKNESLAVGFGVTISIGAAKEAGDFVSRKGTPSIKDFIWDIAGALAGSLAAKLML